MFWIAFEAHFFEFLVTQRPAVFFRFSEDIEDAVELVDIISARKQWISEVQLHNDTG